MRDELEVTLPNDDLRLAIDTKFVVTNESDEEETYEFSFMDTRRPVEVGPFRDEIDFSELKSSQVDISRVQRGAMPFLLDHNPHSFDDHVGNIVAADVSGKVGKRLSGLPPMSVLKLLRRKS